MATIAIRQESETVRDRLIAVAIRSDSKAQYDRTNAGYVGGPHVSRSNPQREPDSWIRPTGGSAYVCLSTRTDRPKKSNIFK